jgi:hypothetical protein
MVPSFDRKDPRKNRKKQSGPFHPPEKLKLQRQPSSSETGTKALAAVGTRYTIASLKRGLHLEVKEAVAIIDGFEFDHLLVFIVDGQNLGHRECFS